MRSSPEPLQGVRATSIGTLELPWVCPSPALWFAESGQDPLRMELLSVPELRGQAPPVLRLFGTAPHSILLCVSASRSGLVQ